MINKKRTRTKFEETINCLDYQIKISFKLHAEKYIDELVSKYRNDFLNNDSSRQDLQKLMIVILKHVQKNISDGYKDSLSEFITESGVDDYILYSINLLVQKKYKDLHSQREDD
jgi:hypothetical protein